MTVYIISVFGIGVSVFTIYALADWLADYLEF